MAKHDLDALGSVGIRDPLAGVGTGDLTGQFLLADLGVLKDFRQDLIQQGETRINFYVTAASVSLVGIGVVSQGVAFDVAFLVSTFVVFGLIAMGLITFVRMVERSIGIVLYARRINRIRRYFQDCDKDIVQYMSFPAYDDVPRFRRMGLLTRGSDSFGLPELVAVLNSIVISSGAAVALAVVAGVSIVWPAILGASVFVVGLVLHSGYHNRRMAAAERSAEVRFPSPKGKTATRDLSDVDGI